MARCGRAAIGTHHLLHINRQARRSGNVRRHHIGLHHRRPLVTRSSHRPVQVIVTADDFGLSPSVDRGIIEAFEQGVVRNTSLLVNFPDVADSVSRLVRVDGLDVGAHLNLTAGRPVLPADMVPTLVDRTGAFPGLSRLLARAVAGRIAWREAIMEWEAQIELGRALGCRFTSIAGHQHVHMVPELARIAAMLARKFAIPAVRLSSFHPVSMVRPLRPKAFALATCARIAGRAMKRQGVFHNDYIIDVPALNASAAAHALKRAIQSLPPGVFELVCHPGHVDETLRRRDGLTNERLIELDVLTAPDIRSLFSRPDIEMTTFGAVSIEAAAMA